MISGSAIARFAIGNWPGYDIEVRGRSLVVAFLAALAPLAACTLLVDFVDQPVPCDGASCVDARIAIDAAGFDGPVIVVDASDGGVDAPNLACKGKTNGYYCARDGLNGYPGDDKDLVVCEAGVVAAVRHCDGGCIFMPPGTPDVCNECGRKADGTYCGKEFPGWLPEHANFLVRCQQGAAPTYTKCTTCTAKDGSSSCP